MKYAVQIDGPPEPSGNAVARRPCDPKQERLKRLDVSVVAGQVHAEAIPSPVVAVLQMPIDPAHKIASQANVVKLVLFV
jgi:hypothetical protein